MNTVHVAAGGLLSALGDGDALWSALLEGRSGLRPGLPFGTEKYVSDVGGWVEGLESPGQARTEVLLRRLFAGYLDVSADTLLLTASTKADIGRLEEHVREGGEELSRALGHAPAALLQKMLSLESPQHRHINAACASGTIALAIAAAMIADGEADSVLVCAFDVMSEFVFSGFSALKALSPDPARPFDRERGGLSLGEAGAYALLKSERRLRDEGGRSLGGIVGWGIASDANHITAPSREGTGLIAAVEQALARACIPAGDVAAIHAHGTGTVYNDAMELTAFRSLFGRIPPLHSIKGATGHTMGAAGVVETLVALKSLETGCIPPTVGLCVPDEAAGGCVSNVAQNFLGDCMLTTNSGFGGTNAALVLRRGV
ncbi:MAG: beta-ketoacyl-[acyl-carrier-protein] synthase family protein [Lentisphaeria bacterium]|nr:beta-ketoacyl-[acyl-carrier-protein] synthase family protein [Lentisphaeria bacterium]